MFQPISFNVICQALEWHDLPRPKLRVLSVHEMDGVIDAEYRATWRAVDLPDRVLYTDMSPLAVPCIALLANELHNCFAADVEVFALEFDALTAIVSALLYVRVDSCIGNWHEYLLNEL